MSSEIKVTNIKHSSSGSNNLVLASDGNVSITNTLSAGTLGGSVTFPNEISKKTIIKYAFSTNDSYALDGTTERIATRINGDDANVQSVSVEAGYTYFYRFDCTIQFKLEASTHDARYGYIKIYEDSTQRSQGGTSFGTELGRVIAGRQLIADSTGTGANFDVLNVVGAVYHSSSATKYVYLTIDNHTNNERAILYQASQTPMYLTIEKVYGNVLTTKTS
jgi:hypothetical protein